MENSKIEWTDHTFNLWIGCTKVSPGCANCYAEALMDGRFGRVQWGPQGARVRTSAANWRKPLAWDRQAEEEGIRYRVFCSSLADVFERKKDQDVEMLEWRIDLFALIDKTPNLDWLLLTKRPGNVMGMLSEITHGNLYGEEVLEHMPNVWIGTSVENQAQADKRIPELLRIPAAVRFLSMEPLLGPVSLAGFDGKVYRPWLDSHAWAVGIDWVIVGGESGPNARPMHPDWVRSIRDQCQAAGVPFLFKQWGEWAPATTEYGLCGSLMPESGVTVDGIRAEWIGGDGELKHPSAHGLTEPVMAIARVGKHAAGRLLDGREWNEYPRKEA